MYGGVFASISKFLEVTNAGTLTLQIVNHLLSAGAIIYVKTNIPQTMFAFECSNPVWGRTTNPYNEDYTCGGSSGGEAALLAMDGAAAGIGSDIGGSLRIPTAYCGIYSLKPASGRVSYFGAKSEDIFISPRTFH
jgi:amidase